MLEFAGESSLTEFMQEKKQEAEVAEAAANALRASAPQDYEMS